MTNNTDRDDSSIPSDSVATALTDGVRTTSVTVVETIASLDGIDPLEAPPLGESIDPDALDRLFARTDSGSVTFRYAGYDVRVHGEGRVVVQATDAEE